MDDGFYTADVGGLDNPITSNGVVTSLGNTANPPNGVFAYGGTPTFPNGGFNGSNYWVDVDVSVDGTFLDDIQLNNSQWNYHTSRCRFVSLWCISCLFGCDLLLRAALA